MGSLLTATVLALLTVPTVTGLVLEPRAACTTNSCFSRALSKHSSSASSDCVSYLRATFSPCPSTITQQVTTTAYASPVTATITATVTTNPVEPTTETDTVVQTAVSTTGITGATTTQVVATTTQTATVTSFSTAVVSTTTTITVTQTSTSIVDGTPSVVRRAALPAAPSKTCTPTTSIPKRIPGYARSCGAERTNIVYSSVCSCLGVRTTTSSLPASTSTVSNTVTSTITPTFSVFTTTTVTGSPSQVTSTAFTTIVTTIGTTITRTATVSVTSTVTTTSTVVSASTSTSTVGTSTTTTTSVGSTATACPIQQELGPFASAYLALSSSLRGCFEWQSPSEHSGQNTSRFYLNDRRQLVLDSGELIVAGTSDGDVQNPICLQSKVPPQNFAPLVCKKNSQNARLACELDADGESNAFVAFPLNGDGTYPYSPLAGWADPVSLVENRYAPEFVVLSCTPLAS